MYICCLYFLKSISFCRQFCGLADKFSCNRLVVVAIAYILEDGIFDLQDEMKVCFFCPFHIIRGQIHLGDFVIT